MLYTKGRNIIVSKETVATTAKGVAAAAIIVASGMMLYDFIDIEVSSDVVVEHHSTTVEIPYFTLGREESNE